jgi:radical SAM protein with 4Fe4S-binding SPASM domain
MSKIQEINKIINRDKIGANYLYELTRYSPVIDRYVSNKIREIKQANFYSLIDQVEMEIFDLKVQFNKLYKSYRKEKGGLNIYLFDVLYLNSKYTLWNCLMNNGIMEDYLLSEIDKHKLDVLNTLTYLNQKYKLSAYSKKYSAKFKKNLIIKKENVPLKLEIYFKKFIILQKKISAFNENKLLLLFKDISYKLKIKCYAPKFYSNLNILYDAVMKARLDLGVVLYKNSIINFLDNKIYKFKKGNSNLIKKYFIKKKDYIEFLYKIYPIYKELYDKNILTEFDINKNLTDLYDFRKKSKDFKGILHLELTQNCNYNCKFCFNRLDKRSKQINYNDYKRTIDVFKKSGKYYTILFGGEPLLNESILDIIRYLSKNKFPIEIFTNASLIDKEFINKIKSYDIHRFRISLDGPENINDKLRGKGTFEKTIKGIKIIKKYSNFPIHLSITLSKDNINHIKDIFEIAHKLKVEGIGFGPLIKLGKAINSKKEISLSEDIQSKELIRKLSKKYNIKAGSEFFCEGPTNIWRKKYKLRDNTNFLRATPCDIGIGMYYLRADGMLCPCPELTQNKFCININKLNNKTNIDNIFSNEINSLRFVTNKCSKCEIFNYCFGSCKARIYNYYNNFNECDLKYKKICNNMIKKIVEKYDS